MEGAKKQYKNKGCNLSKRFILETYTPLHIGSGEELKEGVDFIKGQKGFFVVDIQKTLQSIQTEDATLNRYYSKAQINDLLEISGNKYGYDLISNHNLSQIKKTFSQGNSNISVREYLKDAFLKPLLPGSSLKGAIRTALWESGLSKEKKLSKYIKQQNEKNKKKLDCIEREAKKKIFGSSPQKDIMRALKVSDGFFQIESLELGDIRVANVCDNQIKWKDLSNRANKAKWQEAKGLYVEVIKPNSKVELIFSWDKFLLSDITWNKAQGSDQNSPIKNYQDLKAVLNNHALKIIENEMDFFKLYKYNLPLDFYDKLKKEIEKNKSDVAWLRMSWGSGWTGMTGLTKKLLEQKKELKDCIESKHNKIKKHPYPKTRRLFVTNGTPCCPMGWLKLYPAPQDETVKNPYRKGITLPLNFKEGAFSNNLSQAISKIKNEHRIKTNEEVLKGKPLAEYWKNISQEKEKQKMLEEIKNYWKKKNWWKSASLPRGQKKVKAIYDNS